MVRITEKSFGKKYRAAVISDIHGSFTLLNRLLKREEVAAADQIVFVGDYISRGRESLPCIRFLMEFGKRKNVTVLKGNLERLVNWYLNAEPEAILRHFRGHRYNLFRECIDELGAGPINPETFPGLRQLFRENYADIIDYCANLPNALETEDLVFTHAGLGEWENWKDSSEQEVMKNDPFIKTGRNTTGKWLICGHMPTWNTPLSGNSNNCIVDGNRKCVFIDGGNQVKDFAQLNLLFISSHNGQVEFETAFESWYPVFFAAEDFVPVFDSGCDKDRWPEPEMKVMGDKNGFVECERADGTVCLAHPSHIRIADGRAVYVRNSVSSLLKVAKGEKLELLDAPGGELLFVRKASGEIGWVDRRVLM